MKKYRCDDLDQAKSGLINLQSQRRQNWKFEGKPKEKVELNCWCIL